MSMQDQIGAVGTRLLAATMADLGDDWQELSVKGIDALTEITTLLAEAGIRHQMGDDVSIITNACTAALGNWETVGMVKAADRADAIAASVKKALLTALQIVFVGAGTALKIALV